MTHVLRSIRRAQSARTACWPWSVWKRFSRGEHFAALDHLGLTFRTLRSPRLLTPACSATASISTTRHPSRLVKLGRVSFRSGYPSTGGRGYRVDHFCPGIEAFEAAAVKRYLEGRGVGFRDTDFGPFVPDPDGIQIQLFGESSWSLSSRAASPESYPAVGEPIFRPTGEFLLEAFPIKASDHSCRIAASAAQVLKRRKLGHTQRAIRCSSRCC